MCGRLSVISDPLCQMVSEALGIVFDVPDNNDLRPTQTVGTIAQLGGALSQVNAHWGIKPHWSSRILINATVERVRTAKTFRSAFAQHRCVVPCSGFYEWKKLDTQGKRKQKYLFSHSRGKPLYMAGILLGLESTELITLTMPAPERHAGIHDRFPLFVKAEQVERWVGGTLDNASALMGVSDTADIVASPCP